MDAGKDPELFQQVVDGIAYAVRVMDVDAQAMAASLNATALLNKPFNISSMIDTVHNALEGSTAESL